MTVGAADPAGTGPAFDFLALPFDIPGQEKDQRQFDQLGGLDGRQGTELQGQPGTTLIGHTESGGEKGHVSWPSCAEGPNAARYSIPVRATNRPISKPRVETRGRSAARRLQNRPAARSGSGPRERRRRLAKSPVRACHGSWMMRLRRKSGSDTQGWDERRPESGDGL